MIFLHLEKMDLCVLIVTIIPNNIGGDIYNTEYPNKSIEKFGVAKCNRCKKFSLWAETKMVYPFESTAPLGHEDLPEDVETLFEQARQVLNYSPPASCALLRLVIEKILDRIEPGKDSMNKKIGKLVTKGLGLKVQEALDSVRVVGDNAVHPLHMDLEDDKDTAVVLFDLVNIIVNNTLSADKKIDSIYSKLPNSTKEQIKKRDNNSAI